MKSFGQYIITRNYTILGLFLLLPRQSGACPSVTLLNGFDTLEGTPFWPKIVETKSGNDELEPKIVLNCEGGNCEGCNCEGCSYRTSASEFGVSTCTFLAF